MDFSIVCATCQTESVYVLIGLLYYYQWLVFEYSLTNFNNDGCNLAVLFSFNAVLHLHSFEHKNSVACFNFLTYGNFY